MKNYQKGLLLLAFVPGMVLAGCSDDNPWGGSDDKGGIALNLQSDGRLMRHGTRADDTQCPIVPDANAFGIRLTKSDNSFSKTWSNLEGFNRETEFTIGDYTIEATYGDLNEQGFERPFFKGSNEVHVSPGAVSTVNVTATLANAMVTMRYTDQFLANFSEYSASIQTPNHSEPVLFPKGETRSAFIDPTGDGNVELILTLKNADGKSVNVKPASFKAKPRCNYVITVNVTGNVSKGDAVLSVEFSEDVVTDNIEISLGDELFNSPAPEVRATNFTSGTPVALMEYDELSVSPQFDIYAFGGFKEVNFKVVNADGTYVPSFGSNINLVGADATTQAQLAEAGVKVSGLFRNPDKMAVVNVKEFLGNLPAGTYTIQVEAVDALGRISTPEASEPVELTANVARTEYTIVSSGAIDYMSKELSVVVNTNSEQLKNRIKFRVGNVDATVKSVTSGGAAPAPKRTRADLPYTYTYVLEVPASMSEQVSVESIYGKLKATVAVAVNGPVYDVNVDAFAKFAVFSIETEDAAMKEYLTGNLDVYNGNAVVTPGNITRDTANGFITVKGLTSATTVNSFKLKIDGKFEKAVPQFTTETETAVPNGDFSQNGEHIYFKDIKTGGTFGALNYQWYTTIDRYAPAGWATLNAKTAYSASDPLNTWFVEPSTYLDNGVCVVRTVGYHHNGTLPSKDSSQIYSGKAPGNLEISEGVLFLGSYSFDGTEHRENGVAFSSRPISMTFDYKYIPISGHQAQADLIVLDNENNVIASKTEYLSACADMQTRTLSIVNYPFGKKASKLYVRFRSMRDDNEPALNIPSGSALKISGYNGLTNDIPTNEYKALAVGSVLTLDNVKVSYDGVPTVTK